MREWLKNLSEIDRDCVRQYEYLFGRQLHGLEEYREIDAQVDEMALEWERRRDFFKTYPGLAVYKKDGEKDIRPFNDRTTHETKDTAKKKWFLELVKEPAGTYHANMMLDGKKVEGLAKHVTYPVLRDIIHRLTGIKIPNMGDLIFERCSDSHYAFLDATQPQVQASSKPKDLCVFLSKVQSANYRPNFNVPELSATIGSKVYMPANISATSNLDSACIFAAEIVDRTPEIFGEVVGRAPTVKLHFTDAIYPDGSHKKMDKTSSFCDRSNLFVFSLEEAKEKSAEVYAKIAKVKSFPKTAAPEGSTVLDYFNVIDAKEMTDPQLLHARDLAKAFIGPQSSPVSTLEREMLHRFEDRTRSMEELSRKYTIDFSKLVFRDYDDTGFPLQFFFGVNAPLEEVQALASSLGYKGEQCVDAEFCLNLCEPDDCPVEVVFTFDDQEIRWDEFPQETNPLNNFMQIVRSNPSERAMEAVKQYEEFISDHEVAQNTETPSVSINREKLQKYIEEEMILEFSSPEACMIYFNTYDGQHFRSVREMQAYQANYGFGLDGKWYHISFEEALDVREVPSLDSQIRAANMKATSSRPQQMKDRKDPER